MVATFYFEEHFNTDKKFYFQTQFRNVTSWWKKREFKENLHTIWYITLKGIT